MLDLTGRTALVTGATKGLGRAIAGRLCAGGAHVYLNYAHDDEAAELAVKELAGLPGTATAIKGDVRDPATIPAVLAAVHAEHGRLDICVYNAAEHHGMAALRADPALVHGDLAGTLDPVLTSIAAVAALMAGGPGRVVVVSSTGARQVVPGYVSAGMTKAALECLVRYLAVELAGRGVAVNAVAATKLDKGPDTPGAEALAQLAARTPAGRATTPDDVAAAVTLLCTDEAGWIHGQVLTVDGGLGLRA